MTSIPVLSAAVELAVESPALLGESPMWHPQERVLYYCDIAGRAIRRFNPRTGVLDIWPIESEVASLAPIDGSPHLVVACRDGIWRFDPQRGVRDVLCAAPPYDPAHERFNDGKCGPDGCFWVGTLYEPREPALASLHRFDGRALRRVAEGVTVSNGLGWSPDGGTMYWSDTRAHIVYAFDYDARIGEPSGRRVFARFPLKQPQQDLAHYGGRPDGAAVDVEGCYWVAMFEGRRLLRLSPQGEVIAELPLPVQCPTMPCFGDDDLRTLYITTARDNRPAEELQQQPWAGCLLKVRVDVAGLPMHCFRATP